MNNVLINDANELITKLLYLQRLGYIFRGQANAIWRLIPSIFRPINLKILNEQYPLKDDTYYWYFSIEIKKIVESWAKVNYNNNIPPLLRRIFDLYTFIMKYNFGLTEFNKKNPDLIYTEDENELIISQRDWASEQTFIDFVENTLQFWLNIYNLDGSLRFKAKPFEELTIIEEGFPQHYGFMTAALDFSKNPLKAVYFALQKYNFSCYFSIYAYKQINFKNDLPSKIIENKNPKNIRAIKQEGCFVYLTQPCSFYVNKNKFPTLNDYDIEIQYGLRSPYFKLERILVPKTQKVISFLKEQLSKEDINDKTLAL